jgi:ABC-type sugar transport system ATPase subunit
MPEIFRIADRVTVLRDGKYVDTRPVREVTEDLLVRLMTGRELTNVYGSRAAAIGEAYYHVRRAGGEGFRDVSLSLRRGEILGVAGLVGAGRTELGRALFGAEPLAAGEVELDGKPLRVRSPAEAIRNGIAYLTEDRKEQGLFLNRTVRDNCVAPSLGCFTGRLGWLNETAIDTFATDCRLRFNIVTPSIRRRVRTLSGGNQQKVLLAMWMGIRPSVLIVDEPTRGVDVGARSEIYALLRGLAAEGVGILLISSDLLEVLGLSDRILVMRQGRLAGEFARDRATEEDVIACAAGVGAA